MATVHQGVEISAADKFLTAYEQAKASWGPVNIKKLEEAFKEMTKECVEGRRAQYALPIHRAVFDRIHNILEIGGRPEEVPKLGSFLISLFQFLNEILENDELREMMRNDYGLMYYLSQIFCPELPPEEVALLLKGLERMTRSFVVSWKPPYLKLLVQNVITYVVANFGASEQIYLALQFLVNICSQNPCCVIIARFDPGYRQLWNLLGTGSNNVQDQRIDILVSHLFILLHPSLPETLSAGHQLGNDWTERVLKNHEQSPNGGAVAIESICAGLLLTSELMKTIVAKMESIYEPLSEEIHHATSTSHVRNGSIAKPLSFTTASIGLGFGTNEHVVKYKEVFLKTLLETLKKLHDFVSKMPKIDRSVADAILQYVQILLPSYVPVALLLESYKTALRITEQLLKDTQKGSPGFMNCLTVYLHVIQQVVEGKDRQANQSKLEIDPFLHKLMTKIEITTNVKPADVKMNSLFIRLLSHLSSCPGFSEEVLKKLDLNLIHNLVQKLTSADEIDAKEKWERSMCAVELLSTMSKFSQNTQMLNLLLALVGNREISYHIANCIQNGDERVIRNALTVTGATAFADNTLASISKSLTFIRHQTGASLKLESHGYGLSSGAANGAIKLNQTLKSLNDIRERTDIESIPLFGDMLSWYKMKQEMHEHELSSINAHVYQLNKTISHLKTLLDKQSEFSSRRIFMNEQKDWEVHSLQKKLEKLSKTNASQQAALKHDVQTLEEQVDQQKKRQGQLEIKVQTYHQKIVELETLVEEEQNARKEVQAKLKTSHHDNRTLKKENLKTKSDLDEAKNKVTRLETALKEKEDEKEKADMLLEKEKKMLDTIRGLVGNNFGNVNLGGNN